MTQTKHKKVQGFGACVSRHLTRCFGVLLAFLSLLLAPMTAQAANEKAPSVPIETIHFAEGRLVQDIRNANVWTEFDFNGTKRFSFNTLSFDTKVLRLKGQTGQVLFLIDLRRNTISGEWPGQPMAPLYRITKIDPFVVKKAPSSTSPVEQAPRPNYVPPHKNPRVTVQPAKRATPSSLTRASYKGGAFEQLDGAKWIERAPTGRVYNYRNIGYNDQSVFLYDTSRNVLIELDVPNSQSRISDAGEKLRDLYRLTKLSAETAAQPASEPIPSQENSGVLSALDRALCTSKGGVVERAGMLGAERCTTAYSDGGNLCIDSSNCEGKCLTSANARGKDVVTGQCQKTDNPFGCFSEILGGKLQPGLCID